MYRQISVFFTIIIVLLFIMGGCDSFSLLDQFHKRPNLVLQKNTVKPGEECILYPDGGTGLYSFAVIVDNLYDAGQASDPGTITNQKYIAGNSIGTVKILLIDSAGDSDAALITILPWKPQNFSVDGTAYGPTNIELTWTYELPGYIGGFRILRSIQGGVFEEIANPGSTINNYTDTEASPQLNTYRLYAVAGEFLSAYAEGSGEGIP